MQQREEIHRNVRYPVAKDQLTRHNGTSGVTLESIRQVIEKLMQRWPWGGTGMSLRHNNESPFFLTWVAVTVYEDAAVGRISEYPRNLLAARTISAYLKETRTVIIRTAVIMKFIKGCSNDR
jgi:hypothetical protein